MEWLSANSDDASLSASPVDITKAIQHGGARHNRRARPSSLTPAVYDRTLHRPGKLAERRRTHPERPGSFSRTRRTCLLSSTRSAADFSHHTLYALPKAPFWASWRRRTDGKVPSDGPLELWTHSNHHEAEPDSRGGGVEALRGPFTILLVPIPTPKGRGPVNE